MEHAGWLAPAGRCTARHSTPAVRASRHLGGSKVAAACCCGKLRRVQRISCGWCGRVWTMGVRVGGCMYVSVGISDQPLVCDQHAADPSSTGVGEHTYIYVPCLACLLLLACLYVPTVVVFQDAVEHWQRASLLVLHYRTTACPCVRCYGASRGVCAQGTTLDGQHPAGLAPCEKRTLARVHGRIATRAVVSRLPTWGRSCLPTWVRKTELPTYLVGGALALYPTWG